MLWYKNYKKLGWLFLQNRPSPSPLQLTQSQLTSSIYRVCYCFINDGKYNGYVLIANKGRRKKIMEGEHGLSSLPLSRNHSATAINQNIERIPNLNLEIVTPIASNLGVSFTNEKETTLAPIDILDYIYYLIDAKLYTHNTDTVCSVIYIQ